MLVNCEDLSKNKLQLQSVTWQLFPVLEIDPENYNLSSLMTAILPGLVITHLSANLGRATHFFNLGLHRNGRETMFWLSFYNVLTGCTFWAQLYANSDVKIENMSLNYNGFVNRGYDRVVLLILVDFGKAICTLGHPFPHKFVFCFPRWKSVCQLYKAFAVAYSNCC